MNGQVSRNIQAGMKFIGLRPKDMAKACGKTERTWRSWMADPEMITIGYLQIIAAKLGTTPTKLLEENTCISEKRR